MKYSKIHIIGGPGSGKTYLSQKLSKEYGISRFDLDNIFWDKSQREYVRTTDDYRESQLNDVLANKSWIIEGVYYKWLSKSFEEADVIIVLKTPLFLRQWRIFKRFLSRKFSKSHKKNETLSSFIEMVIWNQKYDNDNLVRFSNFTKDQSSKIEYCNNGADIEMVINA